MKNNRFFTSILTCAAVLSLFMGLNASAVEYTDMVSWNFDASDAYNGDWSKGGYTSSGITPTISKTTTGKLQIDTDYSTSTSNSETWNTLTAVYSFGTDTQDFSTADRIAFDYYCVEGNEPKYLYAVFTSNSTKSSYLKFTDVAVKASESDITGYAEYNVTFPLDGVAAEGRTATKRMQIGEIRIDRSFKGTLYYDNVKLQKKITIELDKELAVCSDIVTAETMGGSK